MLDDGKVLLTDALGNVVALGYSKVISSHEHSSVFCNGSVREYMECFT